MSADSDFHKGTKFIEEKKEKYYEPQARIELATYALRMRYSTN